MSRRRNLLISKSPRKPARSLYLCNNGTIKLIKEDIIPSFKKSHSSSNEADSCSRSSGSSGSNIIISPVNIVRRTRPLSTTDTMVNDGQKYGATSATTANEHNPSDIYDTLMQANSDDPTTSRTSCSCCKIDLTDTKHYRSSDCGPSAVFCKRCWTVQRSPPHLHQFKVFKHRQRTDFCAEEVAILDQAYVDGMNSTGKRCYSKINQIASSLNCSVDRIKAWIGNRRGRDMRKEGSHPRLHVKKRGTQGPNGYSLFVGQQKRGDLEKGEFMSETAQKYRSLSAEEKLEFRKKAAEIRENPLNRLTRDEIIKSQLSVILNACKTLADQNFEIAGFGRDLQNSEASVITFASSEKAAGYIQNLEESRQKDNSTEEDEALDEHSRKSLRKGVRKKFNELWWKAGGTGTKVPYKAISEGKIKIEVTGMPGRTEFRNPSDYSASALKKILAANLTFSIVSSESDSNMSTVESSFSVLPDLDDMTDNEINDRDHDNLTIINGVVMDAGTSQTNPCDKEYSRHTIDEMSESVVPKKPAM